MDDLNKQRFAKLEAENQKLNLLLECQAKFALAIEHCFMSHKKELKEIHTGVITNKTQLLPPGMQRAKDEKERH